MSKPDIATLIETNLRGWAETKLQKLSEDQLDGLALGMGAAERKLDLPDGKMAVIKKILDRKKERSKHPVVSPLVRRAPSGCTE
eukprot:7380260-Prymnesium_polylepis.1